MHTPNAIMRRPEVVRMLGISRGTLYRWMSTGNFPRPIRLGPASIAWRRSDIDEWLASRPQSGATVA